MLSAEQKRTLSSLFSTGQVITDPGSLVAYRWDAGLDHGQPVGIVLPENAADVQRLAKWAQEQGVPLTGRGSGTGYTGGAVALKGGLNVAFTRMQNILEVDVDSRQAIVQPGVINAHLQKHLLSLDLTYPPDPASHSVCTLGGNIAENAGGPHCLKYGVTGNYVVGLEVVLADSSRVQLGGDALDPPEYDFTALITGSEGTLALITQATLLLRSPPLAVKTLTASFDSVAVAGQAVSAVIAAGLLPATIEMMDGSMIAIVEEFLQADIAPGAGALLIFDVDGYMESLDDQLSEIAQILRPFNPLEIKTAGTPAERDLLWRGRRSAAAAVARLSPNELVLDVSLPRSRLAEALTGINRIGAEHGFRLGYLAHAGDGNLHPNLLCDLSRPGELERVYQAGGEILMLCARLGGSIAGEHGVGVEKREYLSAMYQPAEIAAMLEVKHVFDPQGLLNPGKIFPERSPEPPPLPHTRAESMPAALTPATGEEAADILATLQCSELKAYLSGGATKWRGETSDGKLLSTRLLAGIRELSREDFYVRVGAGTRLAELQEELARAGLWVPIASPWPEATLGGVLSARANAPMRTLYGGISDLLMALQVALPGGRSLRFGKALVKDVAGYALSKLFVGAFGTLGLVTEVTLKVRPLPRGRMSLLACVPDASAAVDWGLAILRRARNCAGLTLVSELEGYCAPDRPALVFTAEGQPADLRVELQIVKGLLRDSGAESVVESQTTTATDQWVQALSGAGCVLRLGLAPGKLPGFLASLQPGLLGTRYAVDIANGQVFCLLGNIDAGEVRARLEALRLAGQQFGGHAILFAGPRLWLGQVEAWGEPRSAHALMLQLKRRWDPANVLNAGEFLDRSRG
ncbi:MAG TPA: FAD-linked oxidase C-terminal domain-containing protein [Anaerolineales bacterium]|nr:FAD-linked oxidase C-terminal domain-containing protein [Anaerolineales bacterium]